MTMLWETLLCTPLNSDANVSSSRIVSAHPTEELGVLELFDVRLLMNSSSASTDAEPELPV